MGLRMDQTFIRQTLIDRMRRHGESLEQAASSFAQGMGVPVSDLAPAVDSIRHEGRRNMLLDSPPGVYAKSVTAEARMAGWSTGTEEGDEIWPRLRANLESGRLGDAVDEVDKASTKVVAHLADPHIQSLKKRGHVVGYVQSGKTANYTALGAARWPAETRAPRYTHGVPGSALFAQFPGRIHRSCWALSCGTRVRLGKPVYAGP